MLIFILILLALFVLLLFLFLASFEMVFNDLTEDAKSKKQRELAEIENE